MDLGIFLFDLSCRGNAVHFWHADIHDHNLRRQFFNKGNRFFAGCGLAYDIQFRIGGKSIRERIWRTMESSSTSNTRIVATMLYSVKKDSSRKCTIRGNLHPTFHWVM
jgi:hypothetical protein